MGLGLLGGGVATTKWLTRHGARVTVTDLKTRKELSSSVKALGPAAKKIRFVLGKHRVEDFKRNEIIVVNPGVPRTSKFLKIAKKADAKLENEASIFFRICQNPIIGVTGTRGKTTTVNWLHHILKKRYRKAALTGNSSDNPMLKVLDKLDGISPVVVELSSWHLEFLPKSKKSPHIAVITNIYPDHLNRYPSMRSYVLAKANIFKNQSADDFLLLNKDNLWTKFFIKLKPKSEIVYFPVPTGINLEKFKRLGLHNFYNLNIAILIARHLGVKISEIKAALRALPQVRFRQEVIIDRKNLKIVNDTTATTPEASEAVIKRFAGQGNIILISGGTDKKLEFSNWARTVETSVRPENLYLLEGSATKKMAKSLGKIGYFKKTEPQIFENLSFLIKEVKKNIKSGTDGGKTVLFSPAATSFEKFKNEFDRGKQFNRLARRGFNQF